MNNYVRISERTTELIEIRRVMIVLAGSIGVQVLPMT
jgi:hypothetical protein